MTNFARGRRVREHHDVEEGLVLGADDDLALRDRAADLDAEAADRRAAARTTARQ